MKRFLLTYARCVILTREIEAEDEEAANVKAFELEDSGLLGIETVAAKEDSSIRDTVDDDNIWEVEEVKP